MRKVVNTNSNWNFEKKGETQQLDLPHTWNGTDGQDGGIIRYARR